MLSKFLYNNGKCACEPAGDYETSFLAYLSNNNNSNIAEKALKHLAFI